MTASADRFVSQAAWASVGQLVQALIAFGGLIVLVRLLGAEAYGLFAIALIAVGLLEILVGGHAADGVISIEDLRPAHTDTLFWTLAAIGGAGGLLLWTAGPAVARMLGIDDAAPVIASVAGLPLLTALIAVPGQLLIRRVEFSALTISASLAAALATSAGVLAAINDMGVTSLVIMEYVRRTLTLAMQLYSARWRPGFAFDRHDAHVALRLGGGRIENVAIQHVSTQTMPRGLIGAVLGADMLGVYTVAKRLIDQLNGVLTGPIAAIAQPAVASFRNDDQRLVWIVARAIRVSTIAFWPALIGLIAIAPLLVPVMLGPGLILAVPVVQILALAALRAPLTGFTTAFFAARGQHRVITRLQINSLLLGALLLPIGLYWGLEGACWALAARQWLAWPFGAVAIARAIGMSPMQQLRVLAAAGIAPCLMGASVFGLMIWFPSGLPDGVRLAIVTMMGVILYPLWWMAVFPRARRLLLLAMRDALRGDAKGVVRSIKAIALD